MRKVRIKQGSQVGQDFAYFAWTKQDDVIFTVDENYKNDSDKSRVKLEAPGYGEVGNYGNGHVYADEFNLIDVEFTNDELTQMDLIQRLLFKIERLDIRLTNLENTIKNGKLVWGEPKCRT